MAKPHVLLPTQLAVAVLFLPAESVEFGAGVLAYCVLRLLGNPKRVIHPQMQLSRRLSLGFDKGYAVLPPYFGGWPPEWMRMAN